MAWVRVLVPEMIISHATIMCGLRMRTRQSTPNALMNNVASTFDFARNCTEIDSLLVSAKIRAIVLEAKHVPEVINSYRHGIYAYVIR
jgi:hypothetical protein